MNDRKYELGHESIGRLLFRYSTPAAIAMLTHALYNVVDAIFVGQGAGTLALAGLAVSFPIQMLVLAIAQVVGIGSASLISRSLGAGDTRKAERTAGNSFITVVLLGLLMTVAGLLFLDPLLRLFGATPSVLPYGRDYLSIILLGSVCFAFTVSSNNIVRSEGNAMVAMASMIIGAVVNLVLDYVFIFPLDMGIRGAAIATVIAHVSTFAFLSMYFLSGGSALKIRLGDLKPDFTLWPEVFKIGASSFTRMAAGSLLAIVLNKSAAFYGTDIHLAILGVTNRIMMFTFMPLFGIVQGFQPIASFNYGARNMARVKEALWKATGAAVALATVGFLVIMIFPKQLLLLFEDDAVFLAEGVIVLRFTALLLPFIAAQVIGASMFQAIGRAVPALFLSVSRQILFLVPLIWLLPKAFGLLGIWIAFPLADTLSTLVTGAFVLYEVRRLDDTGKKPASNA
jgi:MATE family, multidrug efflux pump